MLVIALIIMTIYLGFVVINYGWLKSISDSYYHIKHKYIFTFVLWSFSVLMLLGVNDIITTAIYPFACFGIVVVGAYTHFKKSTFLKVMHYVGAISGIGLGILGLGFEFGHWWLVGIYIPLFIVAKLFFNNYFYWIEVFAIYLIGISLLIIRYKS